MYKSIAGLIIFVILIVLLIIFCFKKKINTRKGKIFLSICYVYGLIIIRFSPVIQDNSHYDALILIGYAWVSCLNIFLIYKSLKGNGKLKIGPMLFLTICGILPVPCIILKFSCTNYWCQNLIDFIIDLEAAIAAIIGINDISES